jgi:D-serine deaminase-like pyridoxal phosphate-dependent protein
MGYEGHLLRVADLEEKRRLITEAMGVLCHCRDMLWNENLNCDIVSAGGTGSYQITADCEGITELQAGGGIFADPLYQEQMHLTELEPAVTVLATVVSRPVLDRAILDCGRKTINPDLMMPSVKDHPDAVVIALSAEHCQVKLSGPSQDWKIGDKVELRVPYSDFTTVLHDQFLGFRNGTLETVWPILGRGKLQ